MSNDTAGANGAAMSFAASGGLTLAAADTQCVEHTVDDEIHQTGMYWATATSTASTTVTAKYKRTGGAGTAAFRRRRLIVKKF
jgi:hypothetical protein